MAKTYETIISVLDKFSAPIVGLEDKLGKLGNIGASTQRKLNMSPSAKLWHELTSHVGEAKSKFAELGGSIQEMGGRLAEVLPMLGAIGGAGSVAGLLEMAHATSEAAEALDNISKISGIAVPKLQSLQYAGQQAGVGVDDLNKGFEMLSVRMGRAAMGLDKQTASLFSKMGISLKDASGHVKSAADVMPQLEKAFADTKDPATRAAMAMQLFERSGVNLLPFLTEGPAKMAEMQAQFDKFGYSFSDGDLEGLEQFKAAWNEAELAIRGLTSEISAKLAPVMAPLLTDFASFVASNRDLIALDLKDVISTIGDDIHDIDFKKINAEAKVFIHHIEKLIDDVGGLKTVLEIAGGVMAASFLAPVLEIGLTLGGMGAKMAALTLGPVAELGIGFAELVPEISSFKDAVAALDLVMDANPLGVMVLTAVAAGAAVYELWDHWKEFDAGLQVIFSSIGSEFDKVFGPIIATIDKLDAGLQWAEGSGNGGGAAPDSPAATANRGGRFGGLAAGFNKGLGDDAGGGRHTLEINIKGLPPGSSVTTTTAGNASKPVVHTGTNGTIVNHRNQ
ncbi:hypothetical protein [Acidocella sp.]|uniref:hypothetical protein n=1 Tax=Acidocella sp. TaxID=50710 RepID=UPI002602CB45|nr:hypothetical protein [Acidocella sp.]MDD2794360.1 hypothetical protein [Acidocella sp.]